MSICKSAKELAGKIARSPITFNCVNINTPKKSNKCLKPVRQQTIRSSRLSPNMIVQNGVPSTPKLCMQSPRFFLENQQQSCSIFSKKYANNPGNNPGLALAGDSKIRLGTPSRNLVTDIEVDTPLREDLLRRPRQKRELRILGRGSFGHVFFGNLKGRKVAVKVAQKRSLTDSGEWNSLHLKHPHVIRILEITENISHRVIVMEYAGLYNLQQILDNPLQDLSLSSKYRYSHQIASAVQYCHKNCILHLDLKPANVVVLSGDCCKLGDFGCSRRMKEATAKGSQTNLGQFRCLQGTVAYIAPELFRGEAPTAAADIYSLGIIFWQLLMQKNPFEGDEPHAIIYKVVSKHERPPIRENVGATPYCALIQRCWHPCGNKRPNLDDILQQLEMNF